MVETGILPACSKDLATYAAMPGLSGDRQATYAVIKEEAEKLKVLFERRPHELQEEARYLCDYIKPQMLALRSQVDKAEGLLETGLYPFPSYETLIYAHHS